MRLCSILCLCLVTLTGTALGVSIPTVLVGDAGNPTDPTTGYGAVNYAYRIGTTEVTNAQYAAFLNSTASISDGHGLYSVSMTTNVFGGINRSGSLGAFVYAAKPGMENKPVNFVDAYDAMRFANWLNNGQGAGSTETGAYTFENAIPEQVVRNAGASWFIPSIDEWYKAAYYQPADAGGDTDNYWLYATRSNDVPIRAFVNDPSLNIANPGPNVANYNDGVNFLTSVGTAGPLSESYYGTSDQAGNVAEWMDTIVAPNGSRARSASTFNSPLSQMVAGVIGLFDPPTKIDPRIGFRVAAAMSVPEPSTAALAAIGLIAVAGLARRRR